jgi:hypothetical protein
VYVGDDVMAGVGACRVRNPLVGAVVRRAERAVVLGEKRCGGGVDGLVRVQGLRGGG